MKFIVGITVVFATTLSLLVIESTARAGTTDPLFASTDLLEMTLEGPLAGILRERESEAWLPGRLEFVDNDGERVGLDVRMRARGNFRRENCDHPPLWLKFRKSDVRGTLFAGQNKVKLVVNCGRGDRFEQAVLREYLAYRIFNEITDNSFRVRLLRVTYVDTSDSRSGVSRYAFLIEHKKRLAKRIGRKVLDLERTKVAALDGGQLNLTSVFQFFIGNTDFSPLSGPPGENCCHNYVLFDGGEDLIRAIPYDFDQSGFVDAPYAEPDRTLKLRSVRTRLYRGRCANNDRIPESLQLFREKKPGIQALITEQEGLSRHVRNRLVRYTDDFYKTIDDPRRIERYLLRKCLG